MSPCAKLTYQLEARLEYYQISHPVAGIVGNTRDLMGIDLVVSSSGEFGF
jgi:hypothetical protein